MTLSVDEKGLRYEITPPNTELGRSLVESIKRGDVDGSSFGFLPRGDDGAVVKRKDGRYIRSIKSVELFDVGPVDFPAYKGTSTFARSLDAAKAELESVKSLEVERQKQKFALNERKVEIYQTKGA